MTWTVTCVNHQLVVKPYGKTGENRSIILDQGTLAILRSWRSYQNHERLASSDSHTCASPQPDCDMPGYHARDLVFARPDGNYLHPERFSREFKPNAATTATTPMNNYQRSASTPCATAGQPSPSKPASQ